VEGTPFGRYRLIEVLGEGGMGEVWRAHDTVTDRVVAIKLLPAKLSKDEDFQQRFRREAHAAARLNTPHVVPIHDYGEIDGRLFVSMRLIEGRDLATVLAEGPLDPARAVRIVDQVARALHAAHKVGLIHRDIKPSNILLDADDFAYLIDFGIARAADDTRMTKTGNTIGTFAYIAPERLDGRGDEDARVDIYSLACVLYECLAGEPPFGGDTMARLVAAHLNTPPPRPSIARSDVPAQVDEVIATGMAKDPDHRYATTVELADAAHNAITTPLTPGPTLLDDQVRTMQPFSFAPDAVRQQPADLNLVATQQRPPPPPEAATPPPQPWWQRQRRQALIAAAVVILAAVGITGYLLRQPSTTSQPSSTNTTTAPTSTTPTTAPPVAEAALDGLLLSPADINATMGATGMTLDHTRTVMDDASNVADKACLPMAGPLVAPVYAGSGWTAFREQVLREPGDQWTHGADQGVVLFSSAHDAGAFFTASAQRWPACANRQYTVTHAGKPDSVWTGGPVSNTNGTLTATSTRQGTDWACQRALTARNNVVIDVSACSHNTTDQGVSVTLQIAAKVPT